MVELRIIKENKIKIYNDENGSYIATFNKSGIFSKKYYLQNKDDEVIAVAKSSLFRKKWDVEDMDTDKNIVVKKNLFGKISIKGDNFECIVDNSVNKLKIVDKDTLKQYFIINKSRLISKNSLIIENSEYLPTSLVLVISLIINPL